MGLAGKVGSVVGWVAWAGSVLSALGSVGTLVWWVEFLLPALGPLGHLLRALVALRGQLSSLGSLLSEADSLSSALQCLALIVSEFGFSSSASQIMFLISWLDSISSLASLLERFRLLGFLASLFGLKFARSLMFLGFSRVKISAPDTSFGDFAAFHANQSVFDAVYAFGVHYPGTVGDKAATASGKRLWSSEDYSTYNDGTGAGCWARLLNRNMVNGSMTSTVAWNLVSAYYPQLPYTRNGLMDAFTPWSGRYEVRDPIWVSAHTTQFTRIGWRYLRHDSGLGTLAKRGSYVALTDGEDLTLVVETMSHDHSVCVRPPLPPYTVSPQNATFRLGGSFRGICRLYHWRTQLVFGQGAVSKAFLPQGPVEVDRYGRFSVFLDVDSLHTFTTLRSGRRGSFATPQPPEKPFPIPFEDDYEGYAEFAEPKYLAQQVGSWEVLRDVDGRRFARQTTPEKPVAWCPQEILTTWPLAVIGNGTLKDLEISVRVRVPPTHGTDAFMIGARVQGGGCDVENTKGALLWVYPRTGKWRLATDMAQTKVFASGLLPLRTGTGQWLNLTLAVKGSLVRFSAEGGVVGESGLPSEVAGMGCSGTPGDFCNAAIGSDHRFGYSDWDVMRLDLA